ncbi:hypothetical protein Golomagni_06124 [Golovinomyces magnicellulatus]|nr:hypothetical protein Golomagni_06124 [Golovinomyces magnicellulatus]
MPPQRRRRPVDDDESDEDARPHQRQNREESEPEVESSDAGEEEQPSRQGIQSADGQLAKKLVRYALACDYSRTPIRRDGIKERVLGNQGRAFKRVFALAQKMLREVWGMELRELPVRERMTLQEKRQAMKSNSQPKSGSGSYILSSTLPKAYRKASIIKPSKTPTMTAEATYLGFYNMVVSLIWLNAGELSDQKLMRYLTRLNANQMVASEKTELTLKKMERQGYVIRRVDRPPTGQDGDSQVLWHVGPRAKEEIGLDGVMDFVRTVYGDADPDLEKKLHSSLGVKPRKQLATLDEGAQETAQDITMAE